MALVLVAAERRKTWHLIGAGVLLGCGFWLKYNAAAYGVVVVAALALWPRDGQPSWRSFIGDIGWVTMAGALAILVPVAALGAAGALQDLYLATVTYNLAYSGETYAGTSPLNYLFTFPVDRASKDALWLLGGIGAALAGFRWIRSTRDDSALCGLMAVSWVVAACLSIVINGARDLPQYYVQAAPALALVAAVGLAPLLRGWRTRPLLPGVAMVLLIAAVLRPGEMGHLPGLIEDTTSDWAGLTGRTNREDYLARFGSRPQDKFRALDVERLAASIESTTSPEDTIYVFGFSPGVFVKSQRRSASRFHWSRPVIIEFAAGEPGYGSPALLNDLERQAPAVVALQKQDWGALDPARSVEPNSNVFFHGNAGLESWLTAGYRLERETPLFEVWRRQ
jgi:hypothetical protein